MKKKTETIQLRMTPEKKALWQEYIDKMLPEGYTMANLLEFSVDDKVTGRTQYKEGLEETAMGWYWFIKPTGDNRKMYEREVRADILLNIQENGKKEQNEATR